MDRLVVVDGGGLVVTMNPDGSDRVVLSGEREFPFQPVWSPDATAIAYASRASDAALIVADADASREARRAAIDTPPFYFYWSPTGDELGSLRNGATGGLVHDRFDVGDELTFAEVDTGAPYYFSWNPAGTSTVAHVGVDRLDIVSGDGSTEALGVMPGAFQAPQWTADGIVAAALSGDGQQIVRIDGDSVETLAEVDGSVIFGVSATGRYLAVQSFNSDVDSVSVALLQDPAPPNRLQVIDLDSGERTTVTDRPAVGFFWSPAVDRLLIIEATGEIGELVISVWDGGEIREGPRFVVAAQWFSEFLPFYDQYAQSMSLWAPDARAYAFVGTYEGERGVFVAETDGGTVAKVADGIWVAWSPR